MTEPALTPPTADAPEPPAGHVLALAWARANPLPAALAAVLAATLTFFYAAPAIFFAPDQHRRLTALDWLRAAWTPETHYEHGPLVPAIIAFLVWLALPRLRGTRPAPTLAGLWPLVFGVLLFLLGARALQPRFCWAGLPFMIFGAVLFTMGWRAARVLLFPILCIFFMIPVPGIDQGTVKLQVLATKSACLICNAIGIKMQAVGTSLHAVDESFQFQVIGDCSGINSLMAITLMTAVFAHLTQDRLWKKLVLFSASVPVALVGNMARLTAIMIVAKCFGQEAAGGWFHEISAYIISFPFAFGALCVVNQLLNWHTLPLPQSGPAAPVPLRPVTAAGPVAGKTMGYDY